MCLEPRGPTPSCWAALRALRKDALKAKLDLQVIRLPLDLGKVGIVSGLDFQPDKSRANLDSDWVDGLTPGSSYCRQRRWPDYRAAAPSSR